MGTLHAQIITKTQRGGGDSPEPLKENNTMNTKQTKRMTKELSSLWTRKYQLQNLMDDSHLPKIAELEKRIKTISGSAIRFYKEKLKGLKLDRATQKSLDAYTAACSTRDYYADEGGESNRDIAEIEVMAAKLDLMTTLTPRKAIIREREFTPRQANTFNNLKTYMPPAPDCDILLAMVINGDIEPLDALSAIRFIDSDDGLMHHPLL